MVGNGRSGDAYDRFRSIRQIVQERLTREIQSGRLAPGQQLVEATLAQQFGVSRNPVREALRALEGREVVQFLPNRGAVVATLSGGDVAEIYDILVELEGVAIRKLRFPLPADQLASMERLTLRMNESLDDIDRWLELNEEFHLTLYRASGQQRTCRLIADLLSTLRPYSRIRLAERLKEANEEHDSMLQAARTGRVAVLRELSRRHRQQATQVIIDEIHRVEAVLRGGSAERPSEALEQPELRPHTRGAAPS